MREVGQHSHIFLDFSTNAKHELTFKPGSSTYMTTWSRSI